MLVHYALYHNLASPVYLGSYPTLTALVEELGSHHDEGVLIEVFPAGDTLGTCLALGEYALRAGRLHRIGITEQSQLLPPYLQL